MKDDTFTNDEGKQYRVERRGPAVPDSPGGGFMLIFPVDPPDPTPPREPGPPICVRDDGHGLSP